MSRVVSTVNIGAFNSDALFRTWGSAVTAGLAASGLVKTSDTGQIDWATVNRPTSATTSAGYEIYRFDDTMQSTAPIYLRISYGTGITTSGLSPSLWFTAGTGTDGAGTITGVKTSTIVAPNNDTGAATTTINTSDLVMYFTHTDGYFMAYSTPYTTSNAGQSTPFFFSIDRSRNQSTGAATAEGAYVHRARFGATSTMKQWGQTLNFSLKQITGTDASFNCMPPGDSGVYGNYVFPVYGTLPRPVQQVGWVGYSANDIATLSTFTCKPIGTTTTRTYLALPATYGSLVSNTAITGIINEALIRIAFLWED